MWGVRITVDGIGVVSLVPSVTFVEVSKVAAALAQQVAQHVAPAWGLDPLAVHSYPGLADVPQKYGVLMVMSDIASAYFGYHKTSDGRPVAYIRPGATWSLFASHEAVEMAIDSLGTEFREGPSPVADQGTVRFLVEACDPVQNFSYELGGQTVSDFCLPAYYSPTTPPGTPLSHVGKIDKPFVVAPGGYITWEYQNDFWQLDRFGANPNIKNQGPQNPVAGAYRAAIDTIHPDVAKLSKRGRHPLTRPIVFEARRRREANASYAVRFRHEVDAFQRNFRRTR